MKLIDLQKQVATVSSTVTVTLGAAVAKYGTVAQALAKGTITLDDSAPFYVRNPLTGDYEAGYYTITSATLLTRERIVSSSNNNNAVAFGAAQCEVYCSLPPEYLAGTDVSALTSVTPTNAHKLLLIDPSTGLSYSALVSALLALVPAAAPVVDNPPSLSNLSASATGSTTASGSITTNETGGTLYWLYSTSSTATAAQVKASASNKVVTASGAQTLPGSGLTASTAYYLHVLHRDTAPQDSAVVSLGSPFTTQATGAPAPTVTSVTVSPSSVNLLGGASQTFTATVAGTNSPSTAVNWTCVGGGSINSSGFFIAPLETSSPQTVTVTATSVQDGTKTGTATVTVAAAAAVVYDSLNSDMRGVTAAGNPVVYTGDGSAQNENNAMGGVVSKKFAANTDGALIFEVPSNVANWAINVATLPNTTVLTPQSYSITGLGAPFGSGDKYYSNAKSYAGTTTPSANSSLHPADGDVIKIERINSSGAGNTATLVCSLARAASPNTFLELYRFDTIPTGELGLRWYVNNGAPSISKIRSTGLVAF